MTLPHTMKMSELMLLLCQYLKDKTLEHYVYVHTQRKSMRFLRLNLPNGHLIILVDFAMIFSAFFMEQAKDAFMSSAQTTVVWRHVNLGTGMYVDKVWVDDTKVVQERHIFASASPRLDIEFVQVSLNHLLAFDMTYLDPFRYTIMLPCRDQRGTRRTCFPLSVVNVRGI